MCIRDRVYSFDGSNGIIGANLFNGQSAQGNVVEINDAEIQGSIRGVNATNPSDEIIQNGIIINGGHFSSSSPLTANISIFGSYVERGTATITDNFVHITNGTFDSKEIAAVSITGGTPTAIDGNIVTIDGGEFIGGTIYGVKAPTSSATSNNGVIINGGTFLNSVTIYAGNGNSSQSHNDFIAVSYTHLTLPTNSRV